jgi:hypothetical protein
MDGVALWPIMALVLCDFISKTAINVIDIAFTRCVALTVFVQFKYTSICQWSARLSVYARSHTNARTHKHTHTSINEVPVCSCPFILKHVHARTHPRMHSRTHACMPARPHTCTYTCTHARTHAHTHASTHTHSQLCCVLYCMSCVPVSKESSPRPVNRIVILHNASYI